MTPLFRCLGTIAAVSLAASSGCREGLGLEAQILDQHVLEEVGRFHPELARALITRETTSPRHRIVRPEFDESLRMPGLLSQKHVFYERYLRAHNEKMLLQSWDRWGYVWKFYYDDSGLLRMIEGYYPGRTEWRSCEVFMYENGVISEQYAFEQWTRENGEREFCRNRYAYAYSPGITSISYFTADGKKWKIETRCFDEKGRLVKVEGRLTESWRSPGPLTIGFVYVDNQLKERRLDWGLDKPPSDVKVASYRYDRRGRLKFIGLAAENAAEGGRARYTQEVEYLSSNVIRCATYGGWEGGRKRIDTITYDEDGYPLVVDRVRPSGKVQPGVWKFYYARNPAREERGAKTR